MRVLVWGQGSWPAGGAVRAEMQCVCARVCLERSARVSQSCSPLHAWSSEINTVLTVCAFEAMNAWKLNHTHKYSQRLCVLFFK